MMVDVWLAIVMIAKVLIQGEKLRELETLVEVIEANTGVDVYADDDFYSIIEKIERSEEP